MKVSNIHTNKTTFKRFLVSDKNMHKDLQKTVVEIIKKTCCRTDMVLLLEQKRGVDMYVYSNDDKQGLSAKIIFADRKGNVYEMPNGKYYLETLYNENRDEKKEDNIKSKKRTSSFATNMNKIFNCGEQIIKGSIRKHSGKVQEAEEIKEIFSSKDDEHIFVFEG